MFLKSIEARGFKSFADKTELIFKKGVTAVVGPNGSGKSNISDAVRWVLGEQSVKNLRGGKMEDVIFAGTEFRKPVGVCQVSLTLDNSLGELPIEYSDVTISRRLYRSGESEYYINNRQCRLKDIQELFMDTGIGKEGYSIIGQGKIDAILSGRAEERRGLLEEAAGIVKFKWRKEEAEKKLENTDQNLLRLNDILSTYEERLGPLQAENEKAKTFLKLSESLKEKETNVILDSLTQIERKFCKLKDEDQLLDSKVKDFANEKEESKKELQSLKEKIETHEHNAEQHKQLYYESKTKQQEFVAEINLLKEKILNLQDLIQKSKDQIHEFHKKIEENQKEKVEKEEKVSSLAFQQKKLHEQISLLEKELHGANSSIHEKEEWIKKSKEENIEILSSLSESKNNKLILENEIESLEKKIDQLKSACEGYLNSIKININTVKLFQDQTTAIQEKIKEYESEISSNKHQLTKLSGTLAKEETKLRDLNIQHNKSEANYHMLSNLEKQYEGYNKSVKVLMNDIVKGRVSRAVNQCFVLGDVIHVPRELEVAIEIALGGAISDIITTNEDIAKLLIQYLKEHNIGRATFLPLNIVKGRNFSDPNGEISKTKGFIGVASNLLQYDKRFTNAIEHILGRTLISENMDCALSLARATNYMFKIVTLQGEVINPGGSLTGGSLIHKSANIIGRKREIEEIKQNLLQIEKELEGLKSSIQSKKENIKQLNEASMNLKDAIHSENIEITKLQGKITALEGESEKLKKAYDTSVEEISYTENQLREVSDVVLKKAEEISDFLSASKENEKKITEVEQKVKSEIEHLQKNNDKLTALKIEKAQIDEILNSTQKDFHRICSEINERIAKQSTIETEAEAAEENKKILENNIMLHQESIERISKQLEDLSESLKTEEVERIKLKEKIESATESLDKIVLLSSKAEEEKHKVDIQHTKLEMERDSLYTRLNEELEMTVAEAMKYKKEDLNLDLCKKEILEIKKEISSLGVVNVGAIEEYEQLKEKYSFMNSQRDDLNNAKEELLRVIQEMTEKMKTIFTENFAILRSNFNSTFRELFKGGSADLVLSDGDALNSNIEITVQPPGKKLQNINLMSGGEKVLSAIALLFAILKMKPTPFCILDEIEAALDDANVGRYAEFLKKFSDNIQFIVITHRKGTMEVSDVLYGVTMEEKGVSKIISVNLNQVIA